MVDAKVILDTLWSVVTFGHRKESLCHAMPADCSTDDGRPTPDITSTIDSVDDFFRIRLVCTLLDTCGIYFERGLLCQKMDAFLTFFQVCTKQELVI